MDETKTIIIKNRSLLGIIYFSTEPKILLLKYTYLPWTLTLFITPIYSNYILLIVFRFILRDPNLILEEKNKEFESDLRQKVKAESVKSFLLFRPKRRFCCKLKFMRNFSTIRHLQILAESCRTNCAQFVVPTYLPSLYLPTLFSWV